MPTAKNKGQALTICGASMVMLPQPSTISSPGPLTDKQVVSQVSEDRSPPDGVQLQLPETGPVGGYVDDEEEFLYGPTERPDESPTAGVTPRIAPPPESVRRWLPQLLAAAQQPDAPPELHAFIRLLRAHMED